MNENEITKHDFFVACVLIGLSSHCYHDYTHKDLAVRAIDLADWVEEILSERNRIE